MTCIFLRLLCWVYQRVINASRYRICLIILLFLCLSHKCFLSGNSRGWGFVIVLWFREEISYMGFWLMVLFLIVSTWMEVAITVRLNCKTWSSFSFFSFSRQCYMWFLNIHSWLNYHCRFAGERDPWNYDSIQKFPLQCMFH